MGFKEWVADAPVATFGPFHLRKDSIEKLGGDGGRYPLVGVEVSLEDGEALRRRVTATRVLATGVFALALKKSSGGESFLTIQGDGFAWVHDVPAKKRGDAMKFVTKVRAQAHKVA